MTASFSPDDPPGKNSKLCVQEKNSGKIVGFMKLASPLINSKPRNEWLGRPLQTENLEIVYYAEYYFTCLKFAVHIVMP